MPGPSFAAHKGRRILRIDGTGLLQGELLGIWDEAEEFKQLSRPGTLRVLLNLQALVSARAAADVSRRIIEFTDKVQATAVVGPHPWKMIVAGLRAAGRDNVEFFPDEVTALDWLAGR